LEKNSVLRILFSKKETSIFTELPSGKKLNLGTGEKNSGTSYEGKGKLIIPELI